jgi:hypothetical protein
MPDFPGLACLEPWLTNLNLGLRMSVFSGPNMIVPLALYSQEYLLGVYLSGLDYPESPAIFVA